jgi:exoribonuclease R
MHYRRVHLAPEIPDAIAAGIENLRDSLAIPAEFPPQVLAEAQQVARDGFDTSRVYRDFTRLEFETIDPPSSMDLDQAMFLERRAVGGYRVWYAIADVAAWVKPGGAIDAEAHRRGQTYYAPHLRYSLHPPVLSEQAASLLPDGTPRPALVWQIDLDESGEVISSGVERGLVVSRAKLNYADVQTAIDQHRASPSVALLAEIGRLREQVEVARGGVSLKLSDQEVDVAPDGTWYLEHRHALPDEEWNAQISLLTGMVAGQMMVRAGVGLLRTLPPPDEQTIDRLHAIAHTLEIAWPRQWSYARFVATLDVTQPAHQAMTSACVRLFRGAGYTVIEAGQTTEQHVHGALAATYAHTTAPLRRLVDRYVGEVCLALSAGTPVPEWVLHRLPELPGVMEASDHRAKAFERGVIDFVEALVLEPKLGRTFSGVVVSTDAKKPHQGVVSIPEPAVEAPIHGEVRLGERTVARLSQADPATGQVRFEVA